MPSRREFEKAIQRAGSTGQRVAFLGALLAHETGLRDRLVIVGGSAISVYTKGTYVSEDVDIVGGKAAIGAVLERWGFRREAPYWRRDDLGLLVQPGRDRYFGNSDRLTTIETPYGPVMLAAVEDLVIRRLVYAKSQRDPRFMDEAALLLRDNGTDLDQAYLVHEVRYEGVEREYREAERRAGRK
ncbi:MAG: hypothetical protein HKL79_00710 [Thermoplasmata archaeon]|nr:hypothetical protein [Thermoplasmata archaeon]